MATSMDTRSRTHPSIFQPHLLDLASSLNDLRTQDTLTDVTISIDNRHFRAHKAVLAACSPYFMAMFTSGFQESKLTEVTVKEGTSATMEHLLDFVYTGILNVNEQSIIDILTMASYLQMKSVINCCLEYLKEQMSVSGKADVTWGQGIIFQLYLVADRHEMAQIKDFCWKIFIQDFVVLSKVPGFRMYATAELLDRLLDRADLIKPSADMVPWHLNMSEMLGIIPSQAIAALLGKTAKPKHSEDQIFKAVVSWLTYDWRDRKTHAADLLKKVRLGVVPTLTLKGLLETEDFLSEPQCKQLLTEVLTLQTIVNPPVPLSVQRPDMFSTRGTITALLATGGTRIGDTGPFGRFFHYGNSEVETVWIPLLNLPKPQHISNVQNHTIATLDGKLYLAGGGIHNPTGTRTMLDSFYVYDHIANDWEALENMLCGREGVAMVKMDNLIYAIGGWDEDGDLRIYNDIYDIEKQIWDEGHSEYGECCDPFAIVYHGKILMYGHGINDGLPSDNVYYYDDDDDDDDDSAGMLMDEQREVRTSMHTLQMYDPPSQKWYELLRQRHYVHTAHGEKEQYSCLVVRNDKCYRVVYDKVRDRHCWISKPRVNELVLDLESGAPFATLGKAEEQPWLPEYHVPGAFCIDREIYVNVNGCIISTGEKMPGERPASDKVNFSKWLNVDTPEMADAAVTQYAFDHYNLM